MTTDITQADVQKYLDTHGYAFQYSVLRCADELLQKGRSNWNFIVSEFPVGNPLNPIHIDFILRYRSSSVSIVLVAECKRADPARSNWCFAAAPYTHHDTNIAELVFEKVERAFAKVDAKPYTISTQSEIYQLGFELRASSKGEGHGGRALNDATTQVLRGLNGLIDQVRPSVVPDDREAIFLPVIFTTAALWVSDGDLGAANLKTGHLPNGWATVKKVPWLWYSYNQSPTLRHQYSSVSKIFDFRRVLYAEYTRSVAIVGCEGIETFLQRNFDWLTP